MKFRASHRNFSNPNAFTRWGKKLTATTRANYTMKNTPMDRLEGIGLPGPFGEIPKKLKEYYDSLQEEAIPDRFLDLLEKLDHAERAAVNSAVVEETK